MPEPARRKVICPYCYEPARLVTGERIYPHRPDLAEKRFWHCEDCEAWVGCHPRNPHFGQDGTAPLGRLADRALRQAKQRAHAAFDPLWQPRSGKRCFGHRKEAYAWLAAQLGIGVEDCHIGMFDVETCNRVVQACLERVHA